MVESGMYCVFDKVSEEAGPVFHAKNHGVALRMFQHMMQEQEVQTVEDYELYYVGVFGHEDLKINPKVQLVVPNVNMETE